LLSGVSSPQETLAPLHLAIIEGHSAIAAALLEMKADVNRVEQVSSECRDRAGLRPACRC
jgi:hypothetical protein